MKERGVIFNGEMVRAILDGRKTQTRRIMKVQPKPSKSRPGDFWFSSKKLESMVHVSDLAPGNSPIADYHLFIQEHCCPFGAVGDRIWVRETARCEWQRGDFKDAAFETGVTYKADGERQSFRSAEQHKTFPRRSHAANGDLAWHPSIHMPRWASRIMLEITDVRVERLNSMHDVDAMREGIQNLTTCSHSDFGIPGVVNAQHPVRAFQLLWESIYGTDSWHANPWVWVIEFKRVEGGAA